VLVLCWSAKGGSGTTVVTACLALLHADTDVGVLAIDLAGDLPAVLGLAEPTGPGVLDWLTASPPPADGALRSITASTGCGVDLVGRGHLTDPTRTEDDGSMPAGLAGVPDEAWERLAHALVAERRPVVVDAGLGVPPPPLRAAATASLLVARPCYLGLRRASRVSAAATGVVLVDEPGRALGRRDVEAALGVPVVAETLVDPAVARAVDAGLLRSRVPSAFSRSLRNAA